MLHMCVYMHSRFVENHLIQMLEDGPLISKVVLSHGDQTLYSEDDKSTTVFNFFDEVLGLDGFMEALFPQHA
jgi:hypothetical protein